MGCTLSDLKQRGSSLWQEPPELDKNALRNSIDSNSSAGYSSHNSAQNGNTPQKQQQNNSNNNYSNNSNHNIANNNSTGPTLDGIEDGTLLTQFVQRSGHDDILRGESRLNTWRAWAAYFALALAAVSVALTVYWATNNNMSEGYLGGINLHEKLFALHPVLMVVGMVFLATSALLSYRTGNVDSQNSINTNKKARKHFHIFSHTMTVVCLGLGLYAVISPHNNKNHNRAHAYLPNLSSLHSYIGVTAIIIYFQNYIFGFYYFLRLPARVEFNASRRLYYPIHSQLGVLALLAAACAVVTGFTSWASAEGHCSYAVSSPDLNPAEHYNWIPQGCRIANGAGVAAMLAALLTAASLGLGKPA